MKNKLLTVVINIMLLFFAFVLFLCTPKTEWGDFDADAVLVMRVLGVIFLAIGVAFGGYLYKKKKIINLTFDSLFIVFFLYKIVSTFI